MVAPNDSPPCPYFPGQPVRLLGCFLLWPHHVTGSLPGGGGAPSSSARPRFLSGRDPLTFVRVLADRPGVCVVRSGPLCQWLAPVSALAPVGLPVCLSGLPTGPAEVPA